MPMRVSEQEEESGLDASQHDEKYFQGHLIVNGTNGSLTVTETIHKEIEIVKE